MVSRRRRSPRYKHTRLVVACWNLRWRLVEVREPTWAGLAMYAFLVAAALVVLTNFRGLRPVAAFLAFDGALFGFCFSLYLTYIEGWVLDAWCIYCIGSATLMMALLLCWGTILAIEVRRRREEGYRAM